MIAHVEITDVAAYEGTFDVVTSTSTVEASEPADAIEEAATGTMEPVVAESSYVTGDISSAIEEVVVDTGDDTVTDFVAA